MPLVAKAFIAPLIVACAMFMESVDANVIVTAIPEMARAFGRDPVTLKVAVTSYVLGLGVFIPICGWVADRFGARTVFRTAIGIFVVGSLLCAASTSLGPFTVARFIQGVGGAMMVPVGRIIIFRSVRRSEFIRAMNYLAVPAMLGPAAGPLLGGFITTYLHWRLIFFINIPIGIAGIWLTNRYIADTREAHPGPLDWFGFFLSASAGVLLMLGLSLVGGELVPQSIAFAMCLCGALLVVFYLLHARRSERPLLDLRFFRVPTFQASVLGGSMFRIGLGAVPFLLPLALQEGLGMSAFKSGAITCASAFGGMFMKSVAPNVLRKFGFRQTLLVNAVFSGIAIAACGSFFPGTPTWVIWLVVLLGGFFPSLQFTSLNSLAYAEIETKDVGRATSLASFIQQVSLGLGVTVAGITLEVTQYLNGHASVRWSDFWPAFVVVGLFSFFSMPITARLSRDAGSEISQGTRS
ncbi:MFS transporter [Caballeronia sp. BR00000012568055]|uniref:MFS transporter n=1 Tax=Caballeronia sp. BR00000012568055 TaxID=2918761 RepID=UPI0023F62FE5|nr:MFS transporter [Caballeronia sp. BR00000012568055]